MGPYRIDDEPRPGALQHLAVQPLWPLLAVMFGGAGLSWPWFALNGFAVGSPTRKREVLIAIGGFVGSAVLLMAIGLLANADVVTGVGLRYALVGLLLWKLGVSYWLYVLQVRSFALYEHFGGTLRSGLLVVLAAAFLRGRLLADAPFFAVALLG